MDMPRTFNNMRMLQDAYQNSHDVHASGLIAQASGGGSTEINSFLLSLLDPFSGAISHIPDTNMTFNILKSVRFSTNFEVKQSGDFLLVMPFHSPCLCGRIYTWDPAKQQYFFHSELKPDEDLTESFRQLRFVSGGVGVNSSTLSGTAFTLSGSMVGIAYQDLPDIRKLTHEKILSYKKDNWNVVASVPLSEGIVVTSEPSENYKFFVPETKNSRSEEYVLILNGKILKDDIPLGHDNPLKEEIMIDELAPNMFGHVEIDFDFAVAGEEAGINGGVIEIDVGLEYEYADQAWNGQKVIIWHQCRMNHILEHGKTGRSFKVTSYDARPIARIEFMITKGSMDNLTQYLITWQLKNYSYYRHGVQGPGTIVGVRGASDQMQTIISGVMNYEAVPSSNIARNVPTSLGGRGDPTDMIIAQTLIANQAVIGTKFVYPMLEYYSKQRKGFFQSLSMRHTSMVQAAGLNSILGALWKFAKPVMRHAAQPLGSALGGALTQMTGEQGFSRVGSHLGGMVSQAFAADTHQIKPRSVGAGPVVYSSGKHTSVTIASVIQLARDENVKRDGKYVIKVDKFAQKLGVESRTLAALLQNRQPTFVKVSSNSFLYDPLVVVKELGKLTPVRQEAMSPPPLPAETKVMEPEQLAKSLAKARLIADREERSAELNKMLKAYKGYVDSLPKISETTEEPVEDFGAMKIDEEEKQEEESEGEMVFDLLSGVMQRLSDKQCRIILREFFRPVFEVARFRPSNDDHIRDQLEWLLDQRPDLEERLDGMMTRTDNPKELGIALRVATDQDEIEDLAEEFLRNETADPEIYNDYLKYKAARSGLENSSFVQNIRKTINSDKMNSKPDRVYASGRRAPPPIPPKPKGLNFQQPEDSEDDFESDDEPFEQEDLADQTDNPFLRIYPSEAADPATSYQPDAPRAEFLGLHKPNHEPAAGAKLVMLTTGEIKAYVSAMKAQCGSKFFRVTKAQFPVVSNDGEPIGMYNLLVGSFKMSRNDGTPIRYTSHQVDGWPIPLHVDEKLHTLPKQLNWNPLWAVLGANNIFFSLNETAEVMGTSWHAACMAALTFMPSNVPLTGSPDDEATHLASKFLCAVQNKQKLLIYRGEQENLAMMHRFAQESPYDMRDESNAFALTGRVPALYYSDNFGFLQSISVMLAAAGNLGTHVEKHARRMGRTEALGFDEEFAMKKTQKSRSTHEYTTNVGGMEITIHPRKSIDVPEWANVLMDSYEYADNRNKMEATLKKWNNYRKQYKDNAEVVPWLNVAKWMAQVMNFALAHKVIKMKKAFAILVGADESEFTGDYDRYKEDLDEKRKKRKKATRAAKARQEEVSMFGENAPKRQAGKPTPSRGVSMLANLARRRRGKEEAEE